LLKPLPPAKKLLADKAYDCAAYWRAAAAQSPALPALKPGDLIQRRT
jgi:hypothetical protein